MRDLTANRLRELLDYRPEDGVFYWKSRRAGKALAGAKAGTLGERGYIRIGIDGEIYAAHRLAWLYVYDEWPHNEIDHFNGCKSDNRISNLRDVGRQVNQQNQRATLTRDATRLLGTSLHKATGKWRARIWIDGRNQSLGLFDNQEAAHAAYVHAKRSLHEGCSL